jgi:hypothetical protein
MARTSWLSCVSIVVTALLTSNASGQSAPPAAASLENVTSCVLEGTDVFIGVGKGADARRYKYSWDASIDALCNAKGFAIATPPATARSSNPSPKASPAVPLAATAQAGSGAAFPPSSVAATSQELSAFLAGKSFQWSTAEGTRVKSKFGADGGLAASAPGYYDTGKWRVEDGKLCGSMRKAGDFCNEARFDAGTLYLRRMNGEIVRYEPE